MSPPMNGPTTPIVEGQAHRVDRQTLQQLYVRVCRDSGFRLDMHRACALAATIVGKHPIDIWVAMPSLDVMREIAAGTHPAAHLLASQVPGPISNERGDE